MDKLGRISFFVKDCQWKIINQLWNSRNRTDKSWARAKHICFTKVKELEAATVQTRLIKARLWDYFKRQMAPLILNERGKPFRYLKTIVTFNFEILHTSLVWNKLQYITHIPIHLYRAIWTSRYVPDDMKKVLFHVIKLNSFFAHPENYWWQWSLIRRSTLKSQG